MDALSYSYLLDVAIETGARDERGLDARRNQIAPRSGIGAVRRIGKPGALGPIASERALAVWNLLEQVLLLSSRGHTSRRRQKTARSSCCPRCTRA